MLRCTVSQSSRLPCNTEVKNEQNFTRSIQHYGLNFTHWDLFLVPLYMISVCFLQSFKNQVASQSILKVIKVLNVQGYKGASKSSLLLTCSLCLISLVIYWFCFLSCVFSRGQGSPALPTLQHKSTPPLTLSLHNNVKVNPHSIFSFLHHNNQKAYKHICSSEM